MFIYLNKIVYYQGKHKIILSLTYYNIYRILIFKR
jgi:hypothetical protein